MSNNNTFSIDPNVRDWACSLSGCDGGNVNANIWLCGIEWGAGSYKDYYTKDLPNEIEKGEVELPRVTYDWKDSLTYTYGRSFAKLYMAMNGENVENYREVEKLSGEELLKLNLYPIAFDSTDETLWQKYELSETTGFESKHLFNTWCFFNRFPKFARLREDHKPKLIVCTGVNYLREFLMFFGGNEKIDKVRRGTISPASQTNQFERSYYWVYLDNKTLLVVIPFFSGRYGLNSNHLLKKMGEKISELRMIQGGGVD